MCCFQLHRYRKRRCIMEADFINKDGKLIFRFSPDETAEASLYLELLFEDERRKGHPLPDFGKSFFREFARTRDMYQVEFNLPHLAVGILFFDELMNNIDPEGFGVAKMQKFLDNVKAWNVFHNHLQ